MFLAFWQQFSVAMTEGGEVVENKLRRSQNVIRLRLKDNSDVTRQRYDPVDCHMDTVSETSEGALWLPGRFCGGWLVGGWTEWKGRVSARQTRQNL